MVPNLRRNNSRSLRGVAGALLPRGGGVSSFCLTDPMPSAGQPNTYKFRPNWDLAMTIGSGQRQGEGGGSICWCGHIILDMQRQQYGGKNVSKLAIQQVIKIVSRASKLSTGAKIERVCDSIRIPLTLSGLLWLLRASLDSVWVPVTVCGSRRLLCDLFDPFWLPSNRCGSRWILVATYWILYISAFH